MPPVRATDRKLMSCWFLTSWLDRGLSACGGGLVFCPGGAAQRVGSALGGGGCLPGVRGRVGVNGAHDGAGRVVMVTGTGPSW